MGLWGERVDSIEYYKQQIKDLDRRVSTEFSLVTDLLRFNECNAYKLLYVVIFQILMLQCQFCFCGLRHSVFIYFVLLSSMLDDTGTPKYYQRHKIHSSSHVCLFQFEVGSCCLCTDTTKQESHIMVDELGARTSRCLLEKLGHTIRFLEHSEACNINIRICLGVFLHDTHSFCAISCKLGGS